MRSLPNLDLLRAWAVTTVVLEHILLAYNVRRVGPWQIPWLGVAGVFVFFVHTSLVLMWSLERKPHTLDFYIRRVFRIYPLAILTCILVLAFHAPVSEDPLHFFHYAPPPHRKSLLPAFLLIPNLAHQYLPSGVMWSLPYEVEMYLVLPVIFFFIRKNFTLWPLLLFWGFTIAVCAPLFPGGQHNFFLAIPYFLPGLMAYVAFGRYKARLPAWTFPIFLLILWSVFLHYPGWRVGNALCLAVGLGLPLFHQMTSRALSAVSHTLAKYSYSIYLTHPFSIVLGLYLMPRAPLALQLIVIVTSLAVFAVSGYHLVEYPMIRLGARLAKRVERRYEASEAESFHHISPSQIR